MAWYTQKSYRRDGGDLSEGRLIDALRFEAASDEAAIAVVSAPTRALVAGADYVVLLDARDEVIWPVDVPNP